MADKQARILANEDRATANRSLMADHGLRFSSGRKSSIRWVMRPGKKEPFAVPTNRGNGDPDRPSVIKRRLARKSA